MTMSIFAAAVKCFHARTELLRLAADFIQGREPIENVKDGIFDAFRHDRRSRLLEFQNKMFVFGARLLVEVFRKSQQQNVAHEIEDRRFDAGIAPLRRGDGTRRTADS